MPRYHFKSSFDVDTFWPKQPMDVSQFFQWICCEANPGSKEYYFVVGEDSSCEKMKSSERWCGENSCNIHWRPRLLGWIQLCKYVFLGENVDSVQLVDRFPFPSGVFNPTNKLETLRTVFVVPLRSQNLLPWFKKKPSVIFRLSLYLITAAAPGHWVCVFLAVGWGCLRNPLGLYTDRGLLRFFRHQTNVTHPEAAMNSQ